MDFYQTIQWLTGQLHVYGQRIAALENALRCAEEEIQKLKEKPPIQVGTIQYKFDQLKVETLEGTLSIGLNPQDLQGIEDFAVQNGQPGTPLPPIEMMQRSLKVEEYLNAYMDSELPAFISAAGEKLGLQQPEAYLSFIKNDIKKQLPGRIENHLRTTHSSDTDESALEKTAAELKKEIENGVLAFLTNLPGTVKGEPK
ncbi:spore gernimation protein [Neobacillus notoginsengisoli]|uniref:Spore gernimation protein n=1 Tax=Neobacillus notoginsengisoli TaxID=1578198 RepID=A0A417YZI5_9BACI|nr:spore germination protein GerPC [Neobacillus notoginsengisoli]RHW43164.1 spore gernimation protein [Neobacillus notoginsengisoli]